MSVKLNSIIIAILGLFIIKVTIENFNQAQAKSNDPISKGHSIVID